MDSDNNALERTYFIGGAPRVGKTILSQLLAKKVGSCFVVSTDSIRSAVRESCVDENSDLFILNKLENVSEENWLKNHNELPEKVIEYQNRESIAVWSSIVSFCNNFSEDDAIHIIEGVALLPSLVSGMKNKPKHIFYVGNTSEKHLNSMLDFSKNFPEKDWMSAYGYSKERIEATSNFVREMSLYFKNEAEKYGFPYYEINDNDFNGSIERIIQEVGSRDI